MPVIAMTQRVVCELFLARVWDHHKSWNRYHERPSQQEQNEAFNNYLTAEEVRAQELEAAGDAEAIRKGLSSVSLCVSLVDLRVSWMLPVAVL